MIIKKEDDDESGNSFPSLRGLSVCSGGLNENSGTSGRWRNVFFLPPFYKWARKATAPAFLFFGGEGLPPMLHIIRKGAGQHAAPRGQQRDASWSCFYDDDMYRKGSDSSFNQVHVASRSRGAFLMVSCGQTTGRVTTRQEHVTVIITSGVWWRPGCPTLLALSPSTISLRHKLKLKISGNHVVSFSSDEF